jgi:hypothetical protein
MLWSNRHGALAEHRRWGRESPSYG